MQTVSRVELNSGELSIGRGKKTRRAYGFDEISLVPGSLTLDFELCDVSVQIGKHRLEIPLVLCAQLHLMCSCTKGQLCFAVER